MAELNGHQANGSGVLTPAGTPRHQAEAEQFVEKFFTLFSQGGHFVQHSSVVLLGGEDEDAPQGSIVRWGPPLFYSPNAPVRLWRIYNSFPHLVTSTGAVIAELRNMFDAGVRFQATSVENVAQGGNGVDYYSDVTHVEGNEENVTTGYSCYLKISFGIHISLGETNTWSVKSIRIFKL